MATKKTAVKTVDASEVFGAIATDKGNVNTKSKVPVVTTSSAVKELVTRKRELVAKIDALKAEDEIVSADIISNIIPQYEEICKHNFQNSIRVPAVDESTVTVTWKSAYSAIPTTAEGEIKSVVGDNYSRWFNKKQTITVKEDANLAELLKLVGAENVAKFFSVVQSIEPTASFTEEKYRLLGEEQRQALSTVVKQYKPSIRTK